MITLTLPFAFTPVGDFYSPEFKSYYLRRLSYTVRPGNAKLATLVENWLVAGKVIEYTANTAKITGTQE